MSLPNILAAAPNGAYKQKTDHPELPISLTELVDVAISVHHAGASMLHLHVRDEYNQHSLDPDIYLRTLDAIKDVLDDQLLVQITSESARIFTPEQQISSIKKVNPDCVSISLHELIHDQPSKSRAQGLFHWCAERQVRIQYILYGEEDLLNYFGYLDQDIIPLAPHCLLFVLGRYQGLSSSPNDLKPFIRHIDQVSVPWMVCAFGAAELNSLIEAAQNGGHMRMGFENNLLTSEGKIAPDNAYNLTKLVKETEHSKLKLANVEQTRQILHIRS